MDHALFRAETLLTDRLQRLQWAVDDYETAATGVRRAGGESGHVAGLTRLRNKLDALIAKAKESA